MFTTKRNIYPGIKTPGVKYLEYWGPEPKVGYIFPHPRLGELLVVEVVRGENYPMTYMIGYENV